LTSNVLLPACGFGLAIFVGWIIPERVLGEELGGLARSRLTVLRWLLRYPSPSGSSRRRQRPSFSLAAEARAFADRPASLTSAEPLAASRHKIER
jgi:hypothetical protein